MTVAELIEALQECPLDAICMVDDYDRGTDKWSSRPVSDVIPLNDGVHPDIVAIV